MKHFIKRIKDNIVEAAIGLLTILFILWALYPAVSCEGTAVRGLIRMECIGDK